MTALNKGRPDRLPVSVHQWQDYHLQRYLESRPSRPSNICLDAHQYFQDMGQFWLVDADFTKFSTAEWHDEITIISDDTEDRIYHHAISHPAGHANLQDPG